MKPNPTINKPLPPLMPALLASLALLLAPLAPLAPLASATVLSPYTAQYSARINGMAVTITNTLRTTPQGYRVSTSASNLLGEIKEHEDFHLADDRIVVDAYHHQRSLFGNRRLERLVMDPTHGIARYQRNNETREILLEPDVLGPLSYQVQMRRDLAAGLSAFDYQVLHRGKIKSYRFEAEDSESVALPQGTVEAIRIRRVHDDNDRETIVWLAPDLDYQLVRLRLVEDGDRYELQLADLKAPGASP